MADLFDMNVAGYGFHLTGHMLSLIALIVACFAITGYISFRDNSIPVSAKTGDHQVETLHIDLPASTQVNNRVFKVRQPANTMLSLVFDTCIKKFQIATGGILQFGIGTSATTVNDIAAENATNQIITGTAGNPAAGDRVPGDTNLFGANRQGNMVLVATDKLAHLFTDVERDLFVSVKIPANAIGAGNGGSIQLQFDFYEARETPDAPL